MTLTVEQIIKNTNDDELFCLFGEFLNRLIEKEQITLLPNVPRSKAVVILDKDKYQVIKEMKNDS